jgi:transcriptional regulator with XRE-family HTH domain
MTVKRPSARDVSIGERLRMLREAKVLSRADLAEPLGISGQQLQKYECGHNRISAGRLFEAAQMLDADIAYFFEDLPRKPPLTAKAAPDDQASALFASIHGIADPRVRRRVLLLIAALTSARQELPKRSFLRIRIPGAK